MAIGVLGSLLVKTLVGEGVKRLVSKKARQAPPAATKGLLESKSVQGLGIAAFSDQMAPAFAPVVGLILGLAGLEPEPETILFIVGSLIKMAGLGWGIYGRIKAEKPIGAA